MDEYALHSRQRKLEERRILKHLSQLIKGKVYCPRCVEVVPKPHYCERLLPIELRGKL